MNLRPWQKTLGAVLIAAAIYGSIDYGIRHTDAWQLDADDAFAAVHHDAEHLAAATAAFAAVADGGITDDEADAFAAASTDLRTAATALSDDAADAASAVAALGKHATGEMRTAATEIQTSNVRVQVAVGRLDAARTDPNVAASVGQTLAAESALLVVTSDIETPQAEDFDALADGIFTTHIIALEALGVLLTAAMIGAMIIARPLEGRPDTENYPTKRRRRDLAAIQRTSDVDRNLAGTPFTAAPVPDVDELGGMTAWPEKPPSKPQIMGGEEE